MRDACRRPCASQIRYGLYGEIARRQGNPYPRTYILVEGGENRRPFANSRIGAITARHVDFLITGDTSEEVAGMPELVTLLPLHPVPVRLHVQVLSKSPHSQACVVSIQISQGAGYKSTNLASNLAQWTSAGLPHICLITFLKYMPSMKPEAVPYASGDMEQGPGRLKRQSSASSIASTVGRSKNRSKKRIHHDPPELEVWRPSYEPPQAHTVTAGQEHIAGQEHAAGMNVDGDDMETAMSSTPTIGIYTPTSVSGLSLYSDTPEMSGENSAVAQHVIIRLAQILDELPDETVNAGPIRSVFELLRHLCRKHTMIPETWVIQPNRLKKTSEQWVGRGGFGAVWRAVYYEDPRSAPVHVALKELPASATNAGVVHPDICQEIIMWRRLQHPNIVPMLGIDRHIFPLSIASAWMDNGTITQFLENYPNEDRLRLLREVCEGLRFLHMETFAHGDLKSPNILVDSMRHARLCDFGMTTVIHSLNSANASTESHGEKGTTRYLAPELLDPEQYGLQHAHVSLPADIYALGIVIWEVFAGRVPYGRWRGPQVIQQVLAGYRLTRPERARALGLSDDLWGVVVACWHPNWDMRPTAVQVLGAITEEAASTLVSPNLDPRILVSMAEIFRDS